MPVGPQHLGRSLLCVTLVLTALTAECIVQVADRRITDSGTAAVIEDDRRKQVFVWPNWAFGFTGLAEIHGVATIDAVAEHLKERIGAPGMPAISPDAVATALADHLNDVWSRFPPHLKGQPLLVHGAGFAVDEQTGQQLQVALFVGNTFVQREGVVAPVLPGPRFSSHVFAVAIEPSQGLVVTCIGASVNADEMRLIGTCVKRWLRKGEHPVRLARLLGAVLDQVAARWEAARRPVIGGGTHLLVAHADGRVDFLKRVPGERDKGIEFAMVGPLGMVIEDQWDTGVGDAGLTVRWLGDEDTTGLIKWTDGVYLRRPLDLPLRHDPYVLPARETTFMFDAVLFLPETWRTRDARLAEVFHSGLGLHVGSVAEGGQGRLRLQVSSQRAIVDERVTQPIAFTDLPGGLVFVLVDGASITRVELNGQELLLGADQETVAVVAGIPRAPDSPFATENPEAAEVCAPWVAERAEWLDARNRRLAPDDLGGELDDLERELRELAEVMARGSAGVLLSTNDLAAKVWALTARTGGTPEGGWDPLLLRLAARAGSPLPVYAFGAPGDDPPPGFAAAFQPWQGCSQVRTYEAQQLTDLEELLTRTIPFGAGDGTTSPTRLDVLTQLASTTAAHQGVPPDAELQQDQLSMAALAAHGLVAELADNTLALGVHVLRLHGRELLKSSPDGG